MGRLHVGLFLLGTVVACVGAPADVDAGPVDPSAPDAGDVDAGDVDAGDVDAGDVDAGHVDAGIVDAGDVDAGHVDAGIVDAGSSGDAGSVTSCSDQGQTIPAGEMCVSPAADCVAGACTSCKTEVAPLTVNATGRVISLYLTASDTSAAAAAVREGTFNRGLQHAQHWYSETMGAAYAYKTFPYEAAHVLQGTLTRAEWDLAGDTTCGIYDAALAQLDSCANCAGLLAAAGLPPLGTPNVVYSVVGGGGHQGGCGSEWMSAVEEQLLDRLLHRCPNARYDSCVRTCDDPGGLAQSDPWCDDWPHNADDYSCTAYGAFMHELGHGFGLPHGADRPTSTDVTVMDEWWNFDRTALLSAEDRTDLDQSIYFAAPQ